MMGQVYKNAGIEAAKIGGLDPAMDALAGRTKATILGVSAPHTKTGRWNSSVKTENVRGRSGVRDRLVSVTDPNAMQIEYGHWWVTPEGRRIKWVKGLRLVSKAFTILKGGG